MYENWSLHSPDFFRGFFFSFCAHCLARSGDRKLFSASLLADRLAGGPFKTYVQSNENSKILANLQFWEDVQTYIRMASSTAVDLKFRHGRSLIVTYLQPESVREIDLEPSLRNRICWLLQRGQADVLLSKVADQILEVSIQSIHLSVCSSICTQVCLPTYLHAYIHRYIDT